MVELILPPPIPTYIFCLSHQHDLPNSIVIVRHTEKHVEKKAIKHGNPFNLNVAIVVFTVLTMFDFPKKMNDDIQKAWCWGGKIYFTLSITIDHCS